MKKTRKRFWIVLIIALSAIFVIIPAVSLAIVKWAILPPEKLTPIVLKYTRPLVDGVINCERVELTFWGTFPKVGLKLNDGEIISWACKDSTARTGGEGMLSDTLLKFSRATVTVDIMDYFRRNCVTVEKLFIDEPFFYGLIDDEGRANWEVLNESEKALPDDTTVTKVPVIDMKKLRVRNAHFIYEDRPSDLYVETAGFNLRMDNQMKRGNLKCDIKTGFESLVFDSPAYLLENDLSLQFESKVDLQRGRVSFSDAILTVNDIPFSSTGEVGFENQNLLMDIEFDTKIDNIAKLLAFIPDEYFRNKKKITSKGSLTLAGSIKGVMGDSISPDVNLHLVLDRGSLLSKGSKHGIERIDTDLSLYLCGENPALSNVTFEKLNMVGTNTSFTASGRVRQLVTDPYIDARMKGKLDMGAMTEDILNPDTVALKGVIEADIEASFRMNELLGGDFTRLNAAGKFNMDRVLFADRVMGMSVFMRGLEFTADTTRQKSAYLAGDDLISATLTADTVSLRLGSETDTRIGKLDVQAKTSRSFDTTGVVPLTTHIRMETLRARLPDSIWVSGRNVYLRGGIKASESDRKKGVFAGQITLDTLKYFDVPARSRMIMDNAAFSLQVLPRRDALRRNGRIAGISQGREEMAVDSTARSRREPGSLRNRENHIRPGYGEGYTPDRPAANQDITTNLLRNWEANGSVKFESMRAFTAMFPLPMRIDNTTLHFDTDMVSMTDARLKLGESDLLLTGELTGMRGAMMRGGGGGEF